MVMVTILWSFSAITNAVTTANDRWPSVNLSAVLVVFDLLLVNVKFSGKASSDIFYLCGTNLDKSVDSCIFSVMG